jgi:F0F1-type ATP synthase epsilon subunit
MHVKVYSPYHLYVDEEAYSVTGLNATGPFDILPRHHNFLTLLLPSELVIQTPTGERRVRIARGIMHVKSNSVTVFLDV